jgi:hypothetical protein
VRLQVQAETLRSVSLFGTARRQIS